MNRTDRNNISGHGIDAGDTSVYQTWQRQSDEQPSMAIDSAILTRARKEVEAPSRRRGFLSKAWFAPLALASVAALVISVSDTFNQDAPMSDPTLVINGMASSDIGLEPLERTRPRAPAADVAERPVAVAKPAPVTGVPSTDSTAGGTLPAADIKAQVAMAPAAVMKPVEPATRASSGQVSPLAQALESIRTPDGSFVDTQLDTLFVTKNAWLTGLQELVEANQIDLATQLAKQYLKRFDANSVPATLAPVFDTL